MRDYAAGDLAESLLSQSQQIKKLDEQFFVRGDGTCSFYFVEVGHGSTQISVTAPERSSQNRFPVILQIQNSCRWHRRASSFIYLACRGRCLMPPCSLHKQGNFSLLQVALRLDDTSPSCIPASPSIKSVCTSLLSLKTIHNL